MRPIYMTAISSLICRTTARSWVDVYKRQVFDRHVYDFQAPESLTDSSDFLTYKLLCQGAGLGLESM